MKNSSFYILRSSRAFSLVEMLVVISVIAILAAMLLPAISVAKQKALIKRAHIEMSQIVSAINRYQSTYGRYPVSASVMSMGSNDYTFGGTALGERSSLGPGGSWARDNSEVISILLDLPTFPLTGLATANVNHIKNTQEIKFLDAKIVNTTDDGGVGPDLVYRDPWGKPYIISMDLNYDEKCRDAFYSYRSVSQQADNFPSGHNGLFNALRDDGNSNDYQYNGGVMVWSLGPDMYANTSANQVTISGGIVIPGGGKANQNVNKDNIMSWK